MAEKQDHERKTLTATEAHRGALADCGGGASRPSSPIGSRTGSTPHWRSSRPPPNAATPDLF
jgi:hypothetical protein